MEFHKLIQEELWVSHNYHRWIMRAIPRDLTQKSDDQSRF